MEVEGIMGVQEESEAWSRGIYNQSTLCTGMEFSNKKVK